MDPWIGPRGSAGQRLLGVLREHGPLTRPELARLTGMSVSGVRPLVAELLADGAVREDLGPADTRRSPGRPGAVLVPTVPDGLVLGLDFGHAHVSVALADLQGTQLAAERFALDVDHRAEAALDRAASVARALLRGQHRRLGEVRRAVAGVPGPVDRAGRMRSSTIVSSWWQLAIADEVAARLHLEPADIDVENDAHLGALAEHRAGAGRDCSDFVYVKASHGLGTGLVLGNALYGGGHGLTGELGHTVIDPSGPLCRCGSRGCLETAVSIEHVQAQIAYVAGAEAPASLADAAELPAVRRIVTTAGRALGRALADVCNLLDPQRIVLGGELAEAGAPLVDGVTESIRRFAQPAVADVDVVLSELGERAQVVGATGLAAERARISAWRAGPSARRQPG